MPGVAAHQTLISFLNLFFLVDTYLHPASCTFPAPVLVLVPVVVCPRPPVSNRIHLFSAADRETIFLFSYGLIAQNFNININNVGIPNEKGLRGVLVDTIASVGAPSVPAVNPPFDSDGAATLFNEIDHFCTLSQELGSSLSQNRGKWSEATWKIPCADQEARSFGRARAFSAIHSAYLELKLSTVRSNEISTARRHYQTIINSLHNRILILLTKSTFWWGGTSENIFSKFQK
jgi:hypothetical protein